MRFAPHPPECQLILPLGSIEMHLPYLRKLFASYVLSPPYSSFH